VDTAETVIVVAAAVLSGSLGTILRQYVRSFAHYLADWLRSRRRRRISVKVQVDGDTIELSSVSPEQAELIIKEFVARYPPVEGEGVDE